LMIYYAFMFSLMTLSFWIVRADGLIGVYFNMTSFARQPADVYRGLLKFFLIFCFPMLVTINFPVEAMIKSLSWQYTLWGIFLCSAFLYGTHKFWSLGVNHYRSASS